MVKAPIYINSNKTYIRKSGDYLIVDRNGKKIPCPSEGISYIIKYGNSQVSEQVLRFISDKGIILNFYSYGGKYYGSFIPPHSNIKKIRLNQYQNYLNNKKRLNLAKELIKESARKKEELLKKYKIKTDFIKKQIKNIEKYKDIDSLRGTEGIIAKYYFSKLGKCFKYFKFSGREYNPPKGEINCLLSFIYALLYCEILNKVFEHCLDPFVGFMHEQNNKAYPLVYDISELIKQECDNLVLTWINTKQIKDSYFNKKPDGSCLFNTFGKQIIEKKWIAWLSRTSFNKEKDKLVSNQERIREIVVKIKKQLENGN